MSTIGAVGGSRRRSVLSWVRTDELELCEAGEIDNSRTAAENTREVENGSRGKGGGKETQENESGRKGKRLGMLVGVFIPCFQSLHPLLLYARLPGLVQQHRLCPLILAIATGTMAATATALSLCAVATNGLVVRGGSYYLVSRSLGRDAGVAVGLLWFAGICAGISLHALSLCEFLYLVYTGISSGSSSFSGRSSGRDVSGRSSGSTTFTRSSDASDSTTFTTFTTTTIITAVGLIILLTATSRASMARLSHLALLLFALTLAPLAALLAGLLARPLNKNTPPLFSPNKIAELWLPRDLATDYVAMLAVTFPSVTGLLAGTNRSGILRDPGNAISWGTLAALLCSTLLYLLVSLLSSGLDTGGTSTGNSTSNTTSGTITFGSAPGLLETLAVAVPWSWLGIAGVVMSSLGAALQGFIGAPRLLAAIARDDVVPLLRFLKSSDRSDDRSDDRNDDKSGDRNDDINADGNADGSAGKFNTCRGYLRRSMASVVTALVVVLFGAAAGGQAQRLGRLVAVLNLACFALFNGSVALLGLLRAPSWRPAWRYYHPLVSLLALIL